MQDFLRQNICQLSICHEKVSWNNLNHPTIDDNIDDDDGDDASLGRESRASL